MTTARFSRTARQAVERAEACCRRIDPEPAIIVAGRTIAATRARADSQRTGRASRRTDRRWWHARHMPLPLFDGVDRDRVRIRGVVLGVRREDRD